VEQELMQRPLRLLHVEDSADDAELLCTELEAAGYALNYKRVESGQAMKNALTTEHWDVVVTDFNLPSFNAYDALRLLRESERDIPLIVVSGFIGEMDAVALMKAGAHDYVMKDNLVRLAPAITREIEEAALREQRRQAHRTLAEHRKLLQDILASLGEGLLVADKDGRLILMNVEAERLLGWTEAELAARFLHQTIHCLRPDGSPLPPEECAFLHFPDQSSACRFDDQVFVRKDGSRFPVTYVTTPIFERGHRTATVTAFQDITKRKVAERELEESRHRLEELSAYLQQVREEERTRIARELHDELGQALTALKIDLNWLDEKLPVREQKIGDKLASMLDLLNRTVDSVRRISEDLRPGMLDDLGLAAAIEHHAAKFAEQTGIACDLSMNRDHFALDDQVSTTLFRVLQESLTNVARHAGANAVTVRLQELENEMLLIVKDNGRGLPEPSADKKKTYGLLGMHERVKLLGGSLDISSAPGKGTRIEASIPLGGTSREQEP
jgi:two-component system, NarL family, sensor histidine kinase UhpB